jgi:hypothetical protein
MTPARSKQALTLVSRFREKAFAAGITDAVGIYVDDTVNYWRLNGQITPFAPPQAEMSQVKAELVWKVEVTGGDKQSSKGWRWLGKLTKATVEGEPRNLIYLHDINTGIDWNTAPMECEHCKTNRNRKETVILKHETGTIMQVGTKCVEEFLGDKTFARWCELAAKFVENIDKLVVKKEKKPKRPDPRKDYYPVENILAVSSMCMRNHIRQEPGYNFGFSYSSYSWIIKRMMAYKLKYSSISLDEVNDNDKLLAKTLLAWVAGITPATDYEKNIQTLAKAGAVGYDHIGMVSSILTAYLKHLKKLADAELQARLDAELKAAEAKTAAEAATKAAAQAVAQAQKPVSQHVGKVGERVEMELKLKFYRSFPSDYGMVYLYCFEDPSGNRLIWRTNKMACQVGETYKVKVTIKAHSEYHGTKQTEVFRCVPVAMNKQQQTA